MSAQNHLPVSSPSQQVAQHCCSSPWHHSGVWQTPSSPSWAAAVDRSPRPAVEILCELEVHSKQVENGFTAVLMSRGHFSNCSPRWWSWCETWWWETRWRGSWLLLHWTHLHLQRSSFPTLLLNNFVPAHLATNTALQLDIQLIKYLFLC